MSDFTQEQKKNILERDNYQCQFDKVFGIVKLTKVPCSEKLEVHHKIYRKGKQLLEDGITVCKRCHALLLTDIVRAVRYREALEEMDLNGVFGFNQIKLGGKSV